jgi:hypothetical protein
VSRNRLALSFMFEVLCFIVGLAGGASIPMYLLIAERKEKQHLLNVILKREKVPTLDKPFEGIPEKAEPKPENKHRDIWKAPSPIDQLMAAAEEKDTEEFGKYNLQTEH